MIAAPKNERVLLVLGDLLIFLLALWITLAIRHFSIPDFDRLLDHLIPFSYLFVVWGVIFFIAGLYDQHTIFFKRRLPGLIVRTQLVNVLIAALFFFSIPYFGITPKTTLLIYLVVSSLGILLRRLVLVRYVQLRAPRNALLIGSGEEMQELITEVNANTRYDLYFSHHIQPRDIEQTDALRMQIRTFIEQEHIEVIVVDTRDEQLQEFLPLIYELVLQKKTFSVVDSARMYESIFNRIPLSMLNHRWFLEHVQTERRFVYDGMHRVIDIVLAIILGIPTLGIFPFVALAIKLEDGGPLFSFQTRVGRYAQPLRLVKFRTMTVADDGGKWGSVENKVTRVGAWLRRTRLDELPQVWNVLRGGYSLIGPRPEFPDAVDAYAREIPYYHARHLITPGLSGWAQIYHEEHPHHGVDIAETRNKLSYDLYYVKNRSVVLDITIALKTIRTLISRTGS